MIQTSLFLLLNIIIKEVSTLGYQIWAIFWSGDNLVKFRNIKKHFWISLDDVSIHPSVILRLLMSSQRSFGISKNTFGYLKMMSESTNQWYYSLWYHLRGDKWSPAQSVFLLGPNFSHFGLFVPRSTRFLQSFCYGSKKKNLSFFTGMYTIPPWKQATSRK